MVSKFVPTFAANASADTGTRPISLPFFLPRVVLDATQHCHDCDVNAGVAFVDRAKDHHVFSLNLLAWAIQNLVDGKCINRYLSKYDRGRMKSKLQGRLSQSDCLIPILYFTVERSSPELVRILCKFGADPSSGTKPYDLPVLAYAVLCAEYNVL